MFGKREKFVGIDISKHKSLTKDRPIEEVDMPASVTVPLAMHIGKPAEAVVEVGDKVKVGTLIGEAQGTISAHVHSPVSGEVTAIEEIESFRGENSAIVIKNDGNYDDELMEDITEDINEESLADRLLEAGITGKGGAGFPTAVKYKMEKHETDYLIVNGAECEPYSTTDYRVMIEYAPEIIAVMDKIMSIYTIDEAYIAVENHMEEAIEALTSAIKESGHDDIHVRVLPDTYPQGHAGLQIREVLGIEIEEGKRSGDVGVLQSNVSTVKAMYDAVFLGKALTSRVVTVTGPLVKEPRNLMVPMGMSVSELLDQCGGLKDGNALYINGGPMMGKPFDNLDIPVDKDTTTILVMEEVEVDEEMNCIRCADCIKYCPVNLQPVLLSNAYKDAHYDQALPLRGGSCISCGVCTYVCPSRIPLLDNIQKLNKKWKEMQANED